MLFKIENKQKCVNKNVYICIMNNQLAMIKGIHPGFILERELKKRSLRKGRFALSLMEYPQTIVSITKGKRKMNTALAMKIENLLGIEEGYFMTLQVFHEIEEEKKRQKTEHPDMSKLRKALFWDTEPDKIDWKKQKNTVTKRVFERGNEIEKEEIIRFYGKKYTDKVLKNNGNQASL